MSGASAQPFARVRRGGREKICTAPEGARDSDALVPSIPRQKKALHAGLSCCGPAKRDWLLGSPASIRNTRCSCTRSNRRSLDSRSVAALPRTSLGMTNHKKGIVYRAAGAHLSPDFGEGWAEKWCRPGRGFRIHKTAYPAFRAPPNPYEIKTVKAQFGSH